jgi:hypothetical protein
MRPVNVTDVSREINALIGMYMQFFANAIAACITLWK